MVGNINSRNTAHTAFSSPRLTREVDGAGPREWGVRAVSHSLGSAWGFVPSDMLPFHDQSQGYK